MQGGDLVRNLELSPILYNWRATSRNWPIKGCRGRQVLCTPPGASPVLQDVEMKKILRIERICAAALVGLVVLSAQSAAAQDHGSATFVTGLSMSNGSALGSAISTVSEGFAHRVNLGGRVTVHLAPGFDAIGEAGRIANVLPPLTTAALSFSPIEIGASAFYTEGGMRALLGSSRSVVSPYVEATGGIARVNLRVSGINSTADDLLRLGLGFTSTTSPMAGL